MRRRPPPEPVSPRALARLRPVRAGWVPVAATLGGAAPPERDGGSLDVAPEAHDDGEHDTAPEPRGHGRHRRTALAGWVRLPSAFTGASWQPGRRAVLGVLLVTVVAVAVFGLRVAWARAAADAEIVVPGDASGAGGFACWVARGAGGGGGPVGAGAPPTVVHGPEAGAGEPGDPSAGEPADGSHTAGVDDAGDPDVVVHVVGQVARPGVLHLPVGARVADAVEAAGGATRSADLAAVNLARPLVDGEQVRVPKPGEVVAAAPGGDAPAGGGAATPGGGLVPLNTADLTALDALPGIGPVLAQRIVDWRTEHGRFTTVDELAEVSGIGEKLLSRLRPLVTT
ncbi:helix-hairpin-helix domain-containing protein [Phycicoccus sp. CSK15P-2]|uniref:helix-hairpin-helix domain-containing protein n=1 Tax=Phycicoccus sp. CSK15P-2 TaxID=2807627 RepID=UPI00194F2486|nr:helix-hairpin-helix domain-containing protein [Phycicoccus sp. CSK15P-2]MBM6404651.1 helix-hairpin-helix domain-containing protein [Phycicoccus sp. CSK15P-2]